MRGQGDQVEVTIVSPTTAEQEGIRSCEYQDQGSLKLRQVIESEYSLCSLKYLVVWMDFIGMKLTRRPMSGEKSDERERETIESDRSYFNSNCIKRPTCKLESSPQMLIVWRRFSTMLIERLDPSKRTKYLLNKKWFRLLIDIIWFGGIAYICLKQMTVAVLIHRSHVAQQTLKPQIRLGANRTENCALKQDIYYNRTNRDYENFQNYLYFYNLQHRLGSTWHILPGYMFFIYMMLGAFSLLMMSAGIVFSYFQDRIEIHHFNFVFYPLEERERLKRGLLSMIGPLIESSNLYHQIEGIKPGQAGEQESKSAPKQRVINRRLQEKQPTDGQLPVRRLSRLTKIGGPNSSRIAGIQFCKTLMRVVVSNSIEPRPVKVDRLIEVRKFYYYSIRACNYLNTLFVALGFVIVGGLEIDFRIRNRKLHLECLNYSADAVPINTFAYLPALPSSQEAKEAYEIHAGSNNLGNWYLAAYVELKLWLELPIVVSLFESAVAGWMAMMLAQFYANINIQCYLDRNAWLNQILEIIDDFPLLIHRKNEIERINSSNGSEEQSYHIKALESEANKALLAGYLHFELFKRQHTAYKRIANQILLTSVFLWLEALAVSYYVQTTQVNNLANGLIAFAAWCICPITAFQLFGAMLSKKIERLMRNILKIFACAAQNSMCASYPIELWRRQLLDEKNSIAMYSLSVLGAYVTYKQILTFNVYLICFGLFMLNKSGLNLSLIV